MSTYVAYTLVVLVIVCGLITLALDIIAWRRTIKWLLKLNKMVDVLQSENDKMVVNTEKMIKAANDLRTAAKKLRDEAFT